MRYHPGMWHVSTTELSLLGSIVLSLSSIFPPNDEMLYVLFDHSFKEREVK